MIVGYVGLIGNGKTYLAVREAVRLADRRRAVLASNIWTEGSVPFQEWAAEPEPDADEGPAPRASRVQLAVGEDGFDLDELRQLLAIARARGQGVVLVIDEIGVLMPARFWQKFPVDLMYQFSQSRKLRLDVIWTSQDVEDVEAYLRRKTQWVYRVRAFPTPSVARQERGRRPWVFLVTRWRPGSVGKRDKRLGWEFIAYSRRHERLYDTDELVAPAARLTKAPARRGRGSEEP